MFEGDSVGECCGLCEGGFASERYYGEVDWAIKVTFSSYQASESSRSKKVTALLLKDVVHEAGVTGEEVT